MSIQRALAVQKFGTFAAQERSLMRRFLPVSVACQNSRSETDGLPVTVRLSGWPPSATLASPSSSDPRFDEWIPFSWSLDLISS